MRTPPIVLHPQVRKKLLRQSRQTRNADRRTRCLIVLRLADGWSPAAIARGLSCSPATARKFRDRWLARGFAGLVDRREDNGLPPGEACVWEDQADVDLNPKIGPDWTLPGTQREVPTPGKNVKRYFAAAMDAATDKLVWVRGGRKTSRLFIDLLAKVLKAYPDAAVVHVVLDNYCAHSSRQTRTWLDQFGQRLRLHFLPPYDPDDNRIERKLWREVHANVTFNHRVGYIERLCDEVVGFMTRWNIKAGLRHGRELRAAI